MKFIDFIARKKKNNKNLIIPHQNNENHAIHRIARQNNENHENLIITHQNHENNEIYRIPRLNHEHHEN